MRPNKLAPHPDSRPKAKRKGRGIGSGDGKTAGRGHKGQKSRSGGTVKPGFEDGQMPIQRRVPKFGFTSRIGRVTAELRLAELNGLGGDVITVDVLKAKGLIRKNMKRVKVVSSGELKDKVVVSLDGIRLTKGARQAIESLGGSVAEASPAATQNSI